MTVTSRATETCTASRTPVTKTLKRKEKQFELGRNSSHRGKFHWNFDRGKANLVWVSKEFELSEFELSRFYCIPACPLGKQLFHFACRGHFLLILMILLEDNLPECMPIGQVSFNPSNPKIKI